MIHVGITDGWDGMGLDCGIGVEVSFICCKPTGGTSQMLFTMISLVSTGLRQSIHGLKAMAGRLLTYVTFLHSCQKYHAYTK